MNGVNPGWFYLLGTVLFTVYGQLVIKWRVNVHGTLPTTTGEKVNFFLGLLLDPFIISGLGAAFVAALFWMATLTKFQLSTAYPFMSLSFVLVFVASVLLFHETITPMKVLGLGAILIGMVLLSRGV